AQAREVASGSGSTKLILTRTSPLSLRKPSSQRTCGYDRVGSGGDMDSILERNWSSLGATAHCFGKYGCSLAEPGRQRRTHAGAAPAPPTPPAATAPTKPRGPPSAPPAPAGAGAPAAAATTMAAAAATPG